MLTMNIIHIYIICIRIDELFDVVKSYFSRMELKEFYYLN